MHSCSQLLTARPTAQQRRTTTEFSSALAAGEKSMWPIRLMRCSRGALLLWGPSLPYHYVPDAESPMTLLGFNFDFTRQSAHKTMAIPPAKCGSFDPSLVTEHVTVSDMPYFNKPLYLTNLLHLSARFSEIKDEFLLKKRYFSHRCSALVFRPARTACARGGTSRHSRKPYAGRRNYRLYSGALPHASI